MKLLQLTIVLFGVVFNTLAQNTITTENLQFLDQTKWRGNLMYVNYGDGNEVNLETELDIEITTNSIILNTMYPNELSANGKSKIKLGRPGYFGKEKIKEFEKTNKKVIVVTEYNGQDDEKDAQIVKTYILERDRIEFSKKVIYLETNMSLIRNKYTYTKKK